MISKKSISAAFAIGALAVSGLASAAVVTLNPTNTNGGAGAIDPGVAAFATTGGVLSLGTSTNPSVLTVSTAWSGAPTNATASEAGRIFIQPTAAQNALYGFTNGSSSSPVGLGNYSIYADFTATGAGTWLAPTYFQIFSGLTVNATFHAVRSDNVDVVLGTASLVSSANNFANLTLANSGDAANTVLSAILAFTPAAGYSGPNGFFQAPDPFNININIGSVGGNPGNTTYVIDGSGQVVVSTPKAGESPSTGNFTFTTAVPEPGALSLAGLALLAVGLSSRRKAAAKHGA